MSSARSFCGLPPAIQQCGLQIWYLWILKAVLWPETRCQRDRFQGKSFRDLMTELETLLLGHSTSQWFSSMLLGAVSGSVAALVSNPFFLLKSRFQAIGSEDVLHQHVHPSLRTVRWTDGPYGSHRFGPLTPHMLETSGLLSWTSAAHRQSWCVLPCQVEPRFSPFRRHPPACQGLGGYYHGLSAFVPRVSAATAVWSSG